MNGQEIVITVDDDGEMHEEHAYTEAPNPNSLACLLGTSCGLHFDVIWPDEQEDFKDIDHED